MTPSTLTLRPLFVTRIAVFACVLVFFGFLAARTPAPSTGQADRQSFASALDVASFALFVGVLLWMSWRNWRVSVHLSESEVTVKGFFRDRTVPRSAVLDIAMDQLVWQRADGEIRVTPITAFLTPPTGLAGVVVRHNEKSLSRLRREFAGNAEPWLGGWDDLRRAEQDHHYDPPTYRRPRPGKEPPKHAAATRSRRDALPMMAMLAGSLLLTAFALWQLCESLAGLAGITDTPGILGLLSTGEPNAREGAVGLLLPPSVLAAVGVGMTVRLLYFALRPKR